MQAQCLNGSPETRINISEIEEGQRHENKMQNCEKGELVTKKNNKKNTEHPQIMLQAEDVM